MLLRQNKSSHLSKAKTNVCNLKEDKLKISIAIPDSSLADDTTKLDKTRKISEIARACAIFRIDTIYIYQDGDNNKNDRSLFVTILKYLDTPQFLRKRLFPKMNDLKYAGVLHPLKIPSHVTPSNAKKIQKGDVRDGIVVSVKGRLGVDLGINQLLPYHGKEKIGKRVTMQFKEGYPNFVLKEIKRDEISKYWGYMVKERGSLAGLLTSWPGNIIITSRKGKIIPKNAVEKYAESQKELLVVFGSTSKGVHEIIGNKIKQIQNARVLNFFPNQATETVRLEEAIMGTLSILNLEQIT